MKKTLIALSTAAVLASGAAAADTFVRIHSSPVPAYAAQHDYRYDTTPRHRYDDYHYREPQWNDGRALSVDERQARIRARIHHGIQRGDLTRWEARRLLRELAEIESRERAYEADGRLGRRERVALHRDLDQLAMQLRYERRDPERRY